MPQSGGYQSSFGTTPATTPNYGAQVMGRAFGTQPAATTPAPGAAAPTYAQRMGQQLFGGQQQQGGQQQGGQQQGGGYNYNPQGFGLAGAGQQFNQQQPRPAAPAAAAPAAAAPAATGGGGDHQGQYINGQWVPTITQTTTLSPTEQALLEQQQGLQKQAGGLTGTLMGNVPTTPMDFSKAPAMPTEGQFNQSASDAVYQQQTAMLDPQWKQAEQQQIDSLRDQGIPPGSDAYNQAMTLFNNQKTTAYQQAKDAAIQEGYNVANQQFGQGMEARQQGVQEAQTLYQQPANTLAQLYSAYQGGGGVQMPTANYTPGQVAPTNVTGAVSDYQNAANTAYGNQANVYGTNVGSAAGLAGMLAMSQLYGK